MTVAELILALSALPIEDLMKPIIIEDTLNDKMVNIGSILNIKNAVCFFVGEE